MNSSGLDQLMSPVADCLDEPSLRALVDLRADPESVQRMAHLAERANEGELTLSERAEYETSVLFASFLGTLQSKARLKLAH